MLNPKKVVFPLFALSALLVGSSAVQAQQPVYGYAPYGYAHNPYNNNPWNGRWMPWSNGYRNNTPWNGGWMPWNNGWNNNYGNRTPWNRGWNNGYGNYTPWNRGWNRGYGNNNRWMPWNSNGRNDWSGIAGPFDTMMDGMADGMADGDLALEFDFKLSGKGKGAGKGRSDVAGSGYGRGYGQGYGGNRYGNYPPVALVQAPITPVPEQDNDSDKDGVLTGFDMCPDSAAGAQVDAFGCQADAAIVLRGVNFHTDSDQLTDASSDILDKVATTLSNNENIRVEVAGHTDSDGDAVYNKDLSQRRANTVMAYLAGKGVKAANMQAMGYGEEQPVASNETADGRAENRRVELNRLGQ